MSLNSEEEARYRLDLAKGYLNRARKALASRDFMDTVAEAQLSTENAVKAVISCFQIPSWSHDPSVELREVLEGNKPRIVELLGARFLTKLEEAAEVVHAIAPEHGRASYGDTESRTPPWRLYSEDYAKKALGYAEMVHMVARTFVVKWLAR